MIRFSFRVRGLSRAVRRSRHALLGAGLLALAVAGRSSWAGAPPGYYDTVDDTNSDTLRATLHAVIDDHVRYPYTSSSWDTWNILELAWEDPNYSARILDIYKNASYPKYGGGNSYYDREHIWPSSYGFPDDGSDNYPFTDCHGLALCDSGYNSARSNRPFRNCSSSCAEYPTEYNNGVGGGSGTYPGNSNWGSGAFTAGTWETWMDKRGDVARSIFYMDIRYEGGTHGGTGVPEPDLRLTDSESLIDQSNTGSNEPIAYMGMLTVLLQWHEQDPVDALEMDRNDIVYTWQQNRNPFIDHPEWVDVLYGPGGEPPTEPWINEFHYDNSGNDVGEFVEVAGPAGLDLAGWELVAYDGYTGLEYQTVALSGVIPDWGDCLGAVDFAFAGLQNGAPDGIALVSPTAGTVQLLSYEGTFPAVDGPAAGWTSVDVLVSETGATPAGHSLQLGGAGSEYPYFDWEAPQTDTPGSTNANQYFVDGCPEATVFGCGVNPTGSMTVISGAPRLGQVLTLGVDNPLGTQGAGSLTFLFVSTAADPDYPCGSSIPGFGMNGPGANGELLIGVVPPDPAVSLMGPLWSVPGVPAPIPLAIPSDAALVGLVAFGQGMILDPASTYGVKFGLTEGVEMPIGY